MASLLHLITAITAARYGVNVLENEPPGQVQGESTNVVGSVADMPWGPVDEVTLITSPADLFNIFAPQTFGTRLDETYPAILAYINKTFPASMKIVRTANTGAAVATFTFQDDDPADSVKVDAQHQGILGNQINVEWTANAGDPTARDMTVTVTGSDYSVLYENVVTAVDGQTVTDPGDPFVVVTGVGDEVPIVIAATPLAGGLDGTAAIGDYLGAAPGGRGLEEYADQNVDVDVLFAAEVPQPLVAGWNTGIKAFMETHKKGFSPLATDSAVITPALAIADVPSYRNDRLMYPWPRVTTVNTFDPDRGNAEVDGNSFAAVAIASVVPEKSPGGKPGSVFLKGINGLAITGALTADAYKSLNDAGIAPWFNSTALAGFIIHRGFTTSLVPGKERIFRRRMTDFITLSIGADGEQFVGELLDLDLPNKALGANTSIQVGRWEEFLTALVNDGRIRGYTLDAFGANTQTNLDAGQWRVAFSVKLFSAQEELVFLATIGENVELALAA